MDRKPEPWETGAAGAFLTIDDVSVWALGEDRFRVQSPDGDQEVAGIDRAKELAHKLAPV